jgi:hypothetical protein
VTVYSDDSSCRGRGKNRLNDSQNLDNTGNTNCTHDSSDGKKASPSKTKGGHHDDGDPLKDAREGNGAAELRHVKQQLEQPPRRRTLYELGEGDGSGSPNELPERILHEYFSTVKSKVDIRRTRKDSMNDTVQHYSAANASTPGGGGGGGNTSPGKKGK